MKRLEDKAMQSSDEMNSPSDGTTSKTIQGKEEKGEPRKKPEVPILKEVSARNKEKIYSSCPQSRRLTWVQLGNNKGRRRRGKQKSVQN